MFHYHANDTANVNFIPCVCKRGSLSLRLFYPGTLQEDHIEFQRSELTDFSYC